MGTQIPITARVVTTQIGLRDIAVTTVEAVTYTSDLRYGGYYVNGDSTYEVSPGQELWAVVEVGEADWLAKETRRGRHNYVVTLRSDEQEAQEIAKAFREQLYYSAVRVGDKSFPRNLYTHQFETALVVKAVPLQNQPAQHAQAGVTGAGRDLSAVGCAMKLEPNHMTRRTQLLEALERGPALLEKDLTSLQWMMDWAYAFAQGHLTQGQFLVGLADRLPGPWLPALHEQLKDIIEVEDYEEMKRQALAWRERVMKVLAEAVDDKCLYMLATAVISSEDNSKVAYLPSVDASKYIRTSWSKFLRYLASRGFTIDPAWLERAQAYLSLAFSESQWSHRIVKGQDICEAYDTEDFGRSCMVGSSATKLYAENPDRVRLVLIYQNQMPYGRALLWKCDDGTLYLDRVYPSDGNTHYDYIAQVAEREGWLLRDGTGADGTAPAEGRDLTVTLRDVGHYPYMDTFTEVLDRDGATMTLGPNEWTNGDYRLVSTDDECPWDYDDEEDDQCVTLMCGDCIVQEDFETYQANGSIRWDADAYEWDWADNFVPVLNGGENSDTNILVRCLFFHAPILPPDTPYLRRTYGSVIHTLEALGSPYRPISYGPNAEALTDRWLLDGDSYLFTCRCSTCYEHNQAQFEARGYDFERSCAAGELVRLPPVLLSEPEHTTDAVLSAQNGD